MKEQIDIRYKDTFKLNEKELAKLKIFNQDYQGFLVSTRDLKDISLLPIKNVDYSQFYSKYSINYINSSKPTNQKLIELYSDIQTKGIQHKFLEYLKVLDTNIAFVEPQLLDDKLLLRVNLNNPEYSVVSSELGEGTNRYKI